jgi:hypothetical protein
MSDIQVIIDHIGRVVVGKIVEKTDTSLTLNNPIILHVQPNQSQLQVQSFPYIFMELLTPESKTENNWTFNRASIVESSVELNSDIIRQYHSFNTPRPPQGEPEVIKLFDD